jgi:anti-anti-sigma factor
MSQQTEPDLIEVAEVRGVLVIRFTRRTILDPLLVETLGQRLLGLARQEGRPLLLNFAHVESVTSAMLGKLVALSNAVQAAGGRVAFAHVDPFLLQIFRLCNLPPHIPIHASEADGVQALAPA